MKNKTESAKDAVYAELKKDKSVSIGLGGGAPYFVNTGHYGLNWVISGIYHGGWAGGTVNELYGDPSSGKSLIINQAMTSMQKKDIFVIDKDLVNLTDTFAILDDTEGAYQESFCKMQGLNVKDVITLDHTLTVENHFKQMEDKVKVIRKHSKHSPIGVYCDSISQLSTDHEMKEGMDKVDMQKAKKVHQAMRIYSDFIHSNMLTYLLSSHIIDNMTMWGPKKRVKGGMALAFQSTVRVELFYKKLFIQNKMETRDLGERGDVHGVRVIAEAKKNRIAPPFRFTLIDIYYDRGLDPYSGMLDHLVRNGRVICKRKAASGDNPRPAVWRLDNKNDFLEEELESLLISEDALHVKAAGMEYMPPIRKEGDMSQEVPEREPLTE